MIDYDLDTEHSILHVRPTDPLKQEDFVNLAKAVDPQIEATGGLSGIMVEAPRFPGWDSFGALVSHLRFVREHHKHVKKVAVVTDSLLGEVAPRLATHFVSAEIKQFPAGDTEAAKQWITSDS